MSNGRPAEVQEAINELEAVKNTLPVAYQKCYAPLLSYIASLEQAAEWQLIESAPTDGTWIEVRGGSTEDESEKREYSFVQFSYELNGRVLDEGRWMFAWYDGGYYGEYINPTHWRPLPSSPKENV